MKSSLYIAFLPLIAFATFSFTACGDRLPTSPDGDQIMPLKVGNWWVYREIHRGYITHVKYDTIRIVSEAPPPVDVPGAGNLFHDNKGRTYYYAGKILNVKEEECPSVSMGIPEWCGERAAYPAGQGATFGLRSVYFNECSGPTPITIVAVVDSTDVYHETLGGDFRCNVFSYRKVVDNKTYPIPMWSFYYYFAPGVGLVAMEMDEEIIGVEFGVSKELIDYHVQ